MSAATELDGNMRDADFETYVVRPKAAAAAAAQPAGAGGEKRSQRDRPAGYRAEEYTANGAAAPRSALRATSVPPAARIAGRASASAWEQQQPPAAAPFLNPAATATGGASASRPAGSHHSAGSAPRGYEQGGLDERLDRGYDGVIERTRHVLRSQEERLQEQVRKRARFFTLFPASMP